MAMSLSTSWIICSLYQMDPEFVPPSTPNRLLSNWSHSSPRQIPSERLSVVRIPNLIMPGAFDGAIQDVTHIAHIAPPLVIGVQDTEKDLLLPCHSRYYQHPHCCAQSPHHQEHFYPRFIFFITEVPYQTSHTNCVFRKWPVILAISRRVELVG